MVFNFLKRYVMYTTLNEIRDCHPCESSWVKLLKNLNKTKADDDPLSIVTILDSNGLYDALWCLRTVSGHYREKRLFAVFCAKQVQHLMTNLDSIKAIDVAERYANGIVTYDELRAAAYAAYAAVDAVAYAVDAVAARAAAYAAAYAAARAAADAAVDAAAVDAADAAAYAAARAADADYAAVDAKNKIEKEQENELRRLCNEQKI